MGKTYNRKELTEKAVKALRQATRELNAKRDGEYREWLESATQEEIREDTANVLAEIEID